MPRPKNPTYEYIKSKDLYRKRIKGPDGKWIAIYAKTPKELSAKMMSSFLFTNVVSCGEYVHKIFLEFYEYENIRNKSIRKSVLLWIVIGRTMEAKDYIPGGLMRVSVLPRARNTRLDTLRQHLAERATYKHNIYGFDF